MARFIIRRLPQPPDGVFGRDKYQYQEKTPPEDFGGIMGNGNIIALFPEAAFGPALNSVGNVYLIRF